MRSRGKIFVAVLGLIVVLTVFVVARATVIKPSSDTAAVVKPPEGGYDPATWGFFRLW